MCVFAQLQEQLERFMKMNAELRHKQNVLQTQLKSTVERKADMEADLKEKNKEIERLQTHLDRTTSCNHVRMPLSRDGPYMCTLCFLYLMSKKECCSLLLKFAFQIQRFFYTYL